ncbi:UDP-glucose dehydrogenase [Labilithrix luteola]|uniref:UDP-glucose dehydrogenase n=1 Tax=Labilithrix luteola TaxID=1391654 RepID=A0A0K1PRZ4_9BACT|nr:nucleotide sugar dehydrogenase [Labilithrix luteola]AKU96298.1 UDP-glucose dehydrogenase [Labilithrix luteola]
MSSGFFMQHLSTRIASREAKVGVIGLGYVGIAVAAALADAGFRVVGVDVKADRVARINAGECPIEGDEPELPELLRRVTAEKKLVATTDYAPLAEADVVLIGVDTPVDADRRARFVALQNACRDLGRVMKDGVLVVIESTVAPGTCETIVAPLLERESGKKVDEGFFLGHCPERVMSGKLLSNLRNLPRVCGASTPETAAAMIAFYRTIAHGKLETSDWVTAELVKTAENTLRDVNIAFANELGLVCEAAGADFSRVRALVNELPGRNMLVAGAGVGGHCIPKDPWLLVQGLSDLQPRVLPAARAVNDAMPLHVGRLVEAALREAGVAIAGARVVLLGYAYLANSNDTQNSPSATLATYLRERGANVIVHDPWVAGHATDLWDATRGADAAVLMVAHDAYCDLDLTRLKATLAHPVLIDGRRVVDADAAEKAGFVFRAVGRGKRRRQR